MTLPLPLFAARRDERPLRPCGHQDCSVSTGEHDGLTFGRGQLDNHGYWEIPCGICARAAEQATPGLVAWPFAPAPRPDVLRTLSHKKGAFRLSVGRPYVQEHYLLELQDGSFVAEIIETGERIPVLWINRDLADQQVKNGVWAEVAG